MQEKNPADLLAFFLLLVGGLNWGLIGVFNFDLVATIFGSMTTGSRVVYGLVGLAALYLLTWLPKLMGPQMPKSQGSIDKQMGEPKEM